MRRILMAVLILAAAPLASGAQTATSTAANTASDVCVQQQSAPVLPLQTSGRYIVDSTGRRFKLSGAAWYGAEGTDFVVAGLQVEPLAAIVRHIRCMGINTVRMLWSNEMYESNPIVPDYALAANPQLKGKHALQVFDIVVRELARQGILVILDNHNSNAEWCCGNDGNQLWYNSQYPESSWIADWKAMVARFKDVPQVIGADLRNEPRISATWGGDPATDWHAAAERGGNAVLSVNPNLLIIVEGVNYALDLTGAANLPIQLNVANRLVYSAHDYPFDHNGATTYAALKQSWDQQWGCLLTTTPVWIGEFGNCHNQSICLSDNNPGDGSGGFWFQSFRTYLDQNDIDWSYWPLNGTEASGQGRTYNGEEGYGMLNPYWNSPNTPSELNPPPAINTLGVMQPIMAPNQGPKLLASYPPVITITQPLPGTTIASGYPLALSANAALRSGSSDSITKVNFYANGNLIGATTTAPYSITWQNIAPGSYQIQAEAVTAAGVKTRSETVPVLAINYATHPPAYSSSIAVNFVSYAVTPMASTEVAGVVPQPNWNQALGNTNSGTLTGLVDQNGNATTASVTWTSPNTYSTAIPDQPGNNRMMKGYLDNNNVQPNTVQVAGLPSSFKNYDVIVYFDGGNEGTNPPARAANYRLTTLENGQIHGCAGQTREGSTVSGLDAAGTDFSGTFIQASAGSAGNYVEFVNCTGDNFSLAPVHGGSTDTQYRAPVNGIQILARSR
ncbi:MAG TPA: cellulase family glycosylhydrolase [Pseudacidobacterium sp.]|nr:cellulase family glycosylhydrolase [Pseudacidobacterium sp.]